MYRHQHGLYFWLQDQSRCKHTHECRQISDVALSLEYVKQYAKTHNNLNDKQAYLLEQCVVWQRLSVHLGWECDNVRASYDESRSLFKMKSTQERKPLSKRIKDAMSAGDTYGVFSDKACKNQLATLTTDNSGNGLHQGIICTDGLSGR